MRLETILPHDTARFRLMVDSVSKLSDREAPEHTALMRHFANKFGALVKAHGLDESEDCAFAIRAEIDVCKRLDIEGRATITGALVEVCYLLGWTEAEHVFSDYQQDLFADAIH